MAVGLTPADVFAACEALAARGVPVDAITGHAAWVQLGRGSKSTVQKYWKEWRTLQDGTSPLTRAGALSAIQDTIDRLVEQAIAEERSHADTKMAKLEDEVRQLSRALTAELSETERLTTALTEATASAEAATAARSRAETERDWLRNQLTERDEELAYVRAGRRNREREVTVAAARLASMLPHPER